MKNSLLLLLLLTLCACGPKKDNGTTAKELEDIANLRAVYSQFTGLYCGSIMRKTPLPPLKDKTPFAPNPCGYTTYPKDKWTVPVELSLNVVDVPNGVNDNSEVKYRPELRGTLVRYDVDPSLAGFATRPIRVRYYNETNAMAIDNTDTIIGPNPTAGLVNISAQWSPNTIEGESLNGVNFIGHFKVTRR